MFLTPASQIGLALTAIICLFAAWAGQRPQKVVAAIIFAGWIVSAAGEDRSFLRPQFFTMGVDIVLTIVFVSLAVIWRSLWLSVLAAFQTLTMATHFAMILDPRIWPRASITAYLVWSYMVVASLAWGGVSGLLDRRRTAGAR
ncbi:MAG: hypothetical protein Q7U20_08025 [Caulobacter sp.]|nr:hypothetical protein [Caulobacter sp.]